jgi:hypothetical protein
VGEKKGQNTAKNVKVFLKTVYSSQVYFFQKRFRKQVINHYKKYVCVRYYHIFAWSFPLLSSFIIIFADLVGDATLWCWIGPKHHHFRILFWYSNTIQFFENTFFSNISKFSQYKPSTPCDEKNYCFLLGGLYWGNSNVFSKKRFSNFFSKKLCLILFF